MPSYTMVGGVPAKVIGQVDSLKRPGEEAPVDD